MSGKTELTDRQYGILHSVYAEEVFNDEGRVFGCPDRDDDDRPEEDITDDIYLLVDEGLVEHYIDGRDDVYELTDDGLRAIGR